MGWNSHSATKVTGWSVSLNHPHSCMWPTWCLISVYKDKQRANSATIPFPFLLLFLLLYWTKSLFESLRNAFFKIIFMTVGCICFENFACWQYPTELGKHALDCTIWNTDGEQYNVWPIQLFTPMFPILVAQLQYRITHTVTQMITNHFNAICWGFFSFQGLRKLIDTSRLARKFESKDKLRSLELEHMLPSYQADYVLLRKEIYSVIDLFTVTSGKLCQNSLGSLASAQVFYHTQSQAEGSTKLKPDSHCHWFDHCYGKDTVLTNHKYQLRGNLFNSGCQAKDVSGTGRVIFHSIMEVKLFCILSNKGSKYVWIKANPHTANSTQGPLPCGKRSSDQQQQKIPAGAD